MAEPLGVGLVGCGGISRGLYVPQLVGFAGRVRVVAVCDLVPGLAAERSDQFRDTYRQQATAWADLARTAASPAERERLAAAAQAAEAAGRGAPRVYTDLEQFVRDPEVQIVCVTTQPVMHPVAAIAAAEAGRHVWSEGPMAATLIDADAMIAAARRHGVKMTVQSGVRFYREARQAKLAIESGRLGKLVMGRLDCNWYHTMQYYQGRPYRGTYRGEGGGSVFHHGRYGSDLFLHLMGEPLLTVAATMGTFLHEIETEDASCASLRFASGALGTATTTICAHHNDAIPYDRIEILGERASLQVYRTPIWHTDPIGQAHQLSLASTEPAYGAELRRWLDETIPPTDEDMQVAQMRLFFDAVEHDRPEPITPESARRHIELVRATYKSAITGTVVHLPLTPDDPFYGPDAALPAVDRRGGTG